MPKNQPAIHSCLVVFTDDLRISSHMDALMGDPQVVTITVRQETNGPILDAMGAPFFRTPDTSKIWVLDRAGSLRFPFRWVFGMGALARLGRLPLGRSRQLYQRIFEFRGVEH